MCPGIFSLRIIMSTKSRVESAHIKRIILPMAEAVAGPNVHSRQSSPWC